MKGLITLHSFFRFLLPVCLFGVGILLQACNEDLYVEPKVYGSIRGKVVYDVSRLPAAQVLVKVAATGLSTETDSQGNFRFDTLLVGSYTVQADANGYLATSVPAIVTEDRVPNVTLYLKDDAVQGRPPSTPTTPLPIPGTQNLGNTVILKWKATDPNRDTLRYDVLFFREGDSNPQPISVGQIVDTLVVNNLIYNSTYYWQVTAKDRTASTNGPVWSFRTAPFPEFNYVFARNIGGQFQLFGASERTTPFQITSTGSNFRPIISPNREQIAFISNVETEPQLYIMNRTGEQLRRVTTVPIAGLSLLDLSFCWSPDGTQLLYPSNDKLYAVRTDGTGLRVVAQTSAGRFFAGCDWTEQGNRIVARTTGANVYDNEFVIISPENGSSTPIFTRKQTRFSNPHFSVTGQEVLFSLDLGGTQSQTGRQFNARVHLLTIATGALLDISDEKPDGTNDLEPRFSPNGASILITNTDNTGSLVRNIYTLTTVPIGPLNRRARTLVTTQGEMPSWR